MADLSFELKGVRINPALMNASGPKCGNYAEFKKLADSDAGAIMTKSTSLNERKTNPAPTCYFHDLWSLNSMGLPNTGAEKTMADIALIKKESSKPVIASIVGFSIQDFELIAEKFNKSKAELIEVNLSCPNVIGGTQMAYDINDSDKLIGSLKKISKKPLIIKLPAYLNPLQRKEMADLIIKHKVECITLINTLGDSLVINPETEKTMINPKKGLGGLGGKCIKPVALGNVWWFYNYFREKKAGVRIIGAGGVCSGTDAFEFALAGANAVQVGTAFYAGTHEIFSKIKNELNELLDKKGYSSLNEAVGKLKTW